MLPSFLSFTATATTEIYTLSLHDALPISPPRLCSSSSSRTSTRRSSSTRSTRRATCASTAATSPARSEEHTSELQSRPHLVCRLLLEKKKNIFVASRISTSTASHSKPATL